MKPVQGYSVGLVMLMLAPFAFAQVGGAVGGAVNSAGNAGVSVRPPPPALPPVTASGAGSVGASGAIRADRPLRDGVGMNTELNTNASAKGKARGLDVAALASAGATASLDSRATVDEIRAAARETRDEVLAEVDARLDASLRATGELRRSSRRLDANARVEFNAALDDANAREKALKKSLSTARKAKAEAWSAAQSALAADYEAYASAVARVDAAAARQPVSERDGNSSGRRN